MPNTGPKTEFRAVDAKVRRTVSISKQADELIVGAAARDRVSVSVVVERCVRAQEDAAES